MPFGTHLLNYTIINVVLSKCYAVDDHELFVHDFILAI